MEKKTKEFLIILYELKIKEFINLKHDCTIIEQNKYNKLELIIIMFNDKLNVLKYGKTDI